MKEAIFSSCEKKFILDCISRKQRLDGRQSFDYRNIKITFGSDFGCCQVSLGHTRVFAQVSSELGPPRPTKPKDGVMHINLELSPMASPSFETGRLTDQGMALNRLLERCVKDSLCVDTESLCVIAGEQVWIIRVTVTVLNHDGNILDCACLAAVSALSHFRRRDVTLDHKEITLHSCDEKISLPLTIIHHPLCVTFAFFHHGAFILVDPSELEERVSDGCLVVGMNKHREVCVIQTTGVLSLLREQVLRCTSIAAVKVTAMTELIQAALEADRKSRSSGEVVGFTDKSHYTIETVTNLLVRPEPPPAVQHELLNAINVPDDITVDKDVGHMEQELEAEQLATRTSDPPKMYRGRVGDPGSEEDETVVLQSRMRDRDRKKRSKIRKQRRQQES